MMKILIVEDDSVIARALAGALEKREYQVKIANNFENIMVDFNQFEPHLVLLDINLPFHNGYYWCGQIRAVSKVPIIFISSISESMDMTMAIQIGADDYITKPFDMALTIAKVQALLRRSYEFETRLKIHIQFGDVQLDEEKMGLHYSGEQVALTFTELQIMKYLFKNGENYSKRGDILDYCWQNNQYIDDNTLAVNITRLRKKLRRINLPNFIQTKKNVGYRLVKGDPDNV